MKSDEEKLTASGGVPADEITSKALSITFVLPDSGDTVVMHKPKVKHIRAATADKTVDSESNTDVFLATLSQICTFNGEVVNWRQLDDLAVKDYKFLNDKYIEFTESGK